jgi:hypothetical protein
MLRCNGRLLIANISKESTALFSEEWRLYGQPKRRETV